MIHSRSGRYEPSAQPHQGRATCRGNRTDPADAAVAASSVAIRDSVPTSPGIYSFRAGASSTPTPPTEPSEPPAAKALQRSLGSSLAGARGLQIPR